MSSFKIKFDILDYKEQGILPSLDEYLRHDEIINYREFKKGNIDNCIWMPHDPTEGELSSPEFRERELTRILKSGAWLALKDTVVWLPPAYYFALQYVTFGDTHLEFRLKRLKHVYFKLKARALEGCKGTLTVKNRQDGETTMAMINALWELMDGNMSFGGIGIQSKTRDDAENPCWFFVQTAWQGLPTWIKDELYSDFASADHISEKLKFTRKADKEKGISARNVFFKYFPAVHNAMDGKSKIKICILDEFLKWVECNFGTTFSNYSQFIMPGFTRQGLFDIFSTPPAIDCRSYRDGYQLWQDSNPDEIDPKTGCTKSRMLRYASNPLDGIWGSYDKWGDADPQQIYDHLMRERDAKPKEEKLAEIRANPLTEKEMWETLNAGSVWSNVDGIKAREIFVMGRRFKDEKTKEPCVVYGNLERVDGYEDGDVEFRPADVDHFDLKVARWAFSYLPRIEEREPLKNIKKPPKIIQCSLGLDPFNHRYPTKDKSKQSNGAMVIRKFRDVFETGINKCPIAIYCCRPNHINILYEDALKAAIYTRSMIQYENRNDGFENYAADRGYADWLLPPIGEPANSLRKGDAPSSKGVFLDKGMALIDAATNLPLHSDDTYHLEYYWFIELLSAYLKFDPTNTQEHDLVMADMQSLVGVMKLMHRKIKQPSDVNSAVMSYMFD